jgi:hypothetical protein
VSIAIVAATRMRGHRATQSDDPGRFRMLDRFLTYTKGKQDIWFARKDEIAGLVLSGRAATPIPVEDCRPDIGVTWRSGELKYVSDTIECCESMGRPTPRVRPGFGRGRRRKCNGIKGRASVGVLYFPSASHPKINAACTRHLGQIREHHECRAACANRPAIGAVLT